MQVHFGRLQLLRKAIMARRFHAGPEYYAGEDPRRRMEASDASMISEDRSAIANLPQEVKYTSWPNPADYPSYGLDDTIRGIDMQRGEDYRGMQRHRSRNKY